MLTASALNTRPAHPCSPGPSPTPHKRDAFGSQTTSPFGFGPPLSSSPEGLTSKRPWSARPLRSSPTTEPSPLLRAGPSLCPASVLCRSRFVPFAVLPLADRVAPRPHQRPDQHRDYRFSCSMPAPATGSRHLYTGHRQDNTQVASCWVSYIPTTHLSGHTTVHAGLPHTAFRHRSSGRMRGGPVGGESS